MNRSRFRGVVSFVVVASIGCLILAGCGSDTQQQPSGAAPDRSAAPASTVGGAPDFSLRSLDGETVRLADVLGNKPVVLEFFATWCPACMKHVPEVQKFQDAYVGEELAMYAISVDNNAAVVSRWRKRSKTTYTVLHDADQQVAAKYQVQGIPLTVGISRSGKIIYRDHGFPRGLEKFVAELKEGAPAAPGGRAGEGG